MALDYTVGGAAATSYLSVAAADELNADRLGPQASTWAAAADGEKEKALIQATADIDGAVVVGLPYSIDQALRFPRAIDVDVDDAPLIPSRVARATYEQAAYLLANAQLLDDAAARRARGMYTFDEPEVSGTIALDGKLGLLAPRAEALLTGFFSIATANRLSSIRVRSRYARPTAVSLE